MSEPPFQMHGHRWDPDKKRFFKIVPGQTTDTARKGGESSKAGRKSSEAAGSKRQKQEDEASRLDKHFEATPQLPAIRISDPTPTIAGGVKGAFSKSNLDPITLRQQGRVSIAASERNQKRRLEAAYSHLELCGTTRPYSVVSDGSEVVALETDVDGESLLALTECGIVSAYVGEERPTSVLGKASSHARLLLQTSQTLFRGAVGKDQHLNGVGCTILNAKECASRRRNPEIFPIRTSPQLLMFPCLVLNHASMSWAVHESDRPAPDVDERGLQDVWEENLAVSNCKTVYVFTLAMPAHHDFAQEYSKLECYESDCMAIDFDLGGQVLYCGLRSGAVLMWYWKGPPSAPSKRRTRTLLAKGPSVTRLACVSATELIVVRINGQAQLIDTQSGQVIRQYFGHVNSYDFRLGFAVDRDLRLLALGGLDRRVRVWSLESSLPLGSSGSHTGANLRSEDHEPYNASTRHGQPGVMIGTTLAATEFPAEVRVLHWNPMAITKGRDPLEVQAIREETEERGAVNRWKDLFVGAGAWIYQFSWT